MWTLWNSFVNVKRDLKDQHAMRLVGPLSVFILYCLSVWYFVYTFSYVFGGVSLIFWAVAFHFTLSLLSMKTSLLITYPSVCLPSIITCIFNNCSCYYYYLKCIIGNECGTHFEINPKDICSILLLLSLILSFFVCCVIAATWYFWNLFLPMLCFRFCFSLLLFGKVC